MLGLPKRPTSDPPRDDERRLASRLLDLPLRAPRLVLAVAGVLTAILGIHAPFVAIDGSIENLLVTGDPARAFHEQAEKTFGSDEVTLVGVFAEDVFAPATLAKIDRLSRELAPIEGVREVVSLTTVAGVEPSPEGLRVGRLLRSLPQEAEAATRYRGRVLGDPLYRSVVSPDGRATTVAVLYEPMTDGEFAGRRIHDRLRTAVASLGGPEEYAIAGVPTLKAEGARQMEEEVRRFSALGMLVVAVVLTLTFRRLRGVLLPLLAIAIGVVWTNGLMALLGRPFTIGTLVLNPILMSIGVAESMYVMTRYFQLARIGRSSRDLVEETLAGVGLPIALAAFTTVLGFATLIPHPVPTIRDLGIWAAFGISVSFFAAITVVPAILVLLPPPVPRAPRDEAFLTGGLARFARVTGAHPWLMMALAFGLCVASLPGIARLRIETDYLGFFDEQSAIRVASDRISTLLAGTQPIYVVVEGEGPRALTRVDSLEGLRRLQRFLAHRPGVDEVVSPIDQLVAARRALVPGAGDELPATQEEADQILLMVNRSSIRHVVSRDSGRANLVAYTSLSSSSDVDRLVADVEGYAERVLPEGIRARPTGTVVLLNRTSDVIARQQVYGLVQMLLALVVVMGALFRSLRVGLLSLVPNVVPIFLLFALMGWAEIPLDVSTSMIAAIALGIVVDDTTHWLTEFASELDRGADRRAAVEAAMRRVGRPIVFTAVALAAGFLIAGFSSFQPVRNFGLLSAATMVIAVFADLVITPAAAALTGPATNERAERRDTVTLDALPIATSGGTHV